MCVCGLLVIMSDSDNNNKFLIGTIPPFDPDQDEWSMYCELLGHYFMANAIADDRRQCAILLSVIGMESYKRLRTVLAPAKPADLTFRQLCDRLAQHYAPVVVFRERCLFYAAIREAGESVQQYYGRLKRLSDRCAFDESLETKMVDRFVTGLGTGRILDRLCEEGARLGIQRAVALAVELEQQCEREMTRDRLSAVRDDECTERVSVNGNSVLRIKNDVSFTNGRRIPIDMNNKATLLNRKSCNLCSSVDKSHDNLNRAYCVTKEKIDSLKLNYVSKQTLQKFKNPSIGS